MCKGCQHEADCAGLGKELKELMPKESCFQPETGGILSALRRMTGSPGVLRVRTLQPLEDQRPNT